MGHKELVEIYKSKAKCCFCYEFMILNHQAFSGYSLDLFLDSYPLIFFSFLNLFPLDLFLSLSFIHYWMRSVIMYSPNLKNPLALCLHINVVMYMWRFGVVYGTILDSHPPIFLSFNKLFSLHCSYHILWYTLTNEKCYHLFS